MARKVHIEFLPRGREGGGVLPWVIAVMTFLCVLALTASFASFNASSKWASELSSSMTVQIVHESAEERTRQAALAIAKLRQTPGIASANIVSDLEIEALLEPWLGAGNVSEDLPIPVMIAVGLEPGAYIDLAALEASLRTDAPDASVDSHQRWIAQFYRLSSAVQVGVGLVIILILLTTIAMVVFATRARLASHRENIEIVYLIGAEESLITREFRRHFLTYGLKGGIAGLIASALCISGIFWMTINMDGSLVPDLHLQWFQILSIIIMPLIVAFLSMITAGIAVKKALGQMV